MHCNENKLYYHLPRNINRLCDIKVYSNQVVFEGEFWYLKDKEFYRNKNPKEVASIQNFLGIGYLKKRSYRKCVLFVLGGLLLSIINSIIEKLSELVDHANFILQWIGASLSLPEWMTITLNVITVLCLVLGALYFFSKKKVVEISFIDKRICIPQKSISNAEYAELYRVIKQLSQN